MLTSKQRAFLRAKANGIETIFQIGKGGITEVIASEVDAALKARELVKIKVLENAGLTAREASDLLCPMVGADPVICVGMRFVVYRASDEHLYKLPAAK